MATITEITLVDFLHAVGYSGIYSGSQGLSQATGLAQTNVSVINSVALDTTINVSSGFNTYYKMQGWNPILQAYETWHCMNEPLVDPPSGNTLENVSIVSSWKDR